jgi:D-alanyl-D-alanine carboxypeptidase (penicillin-binding protein 5/6)
VHKTASPPVAEFLTLPRPGLEADPPVPAFDVRAASAILVDGHTGAVLFAHNPDESRPPASVTKIMTALLVLEAGRLTDVVTVSRRAATTGGYRLGLRAGQRISLEDLLAAILIRSANDAAVAAAEHLGGSVAGFAEMMNVKAQAVGMTQTRFANPHGLDEPGHVTTARDMARLTRVALANPHFARLVSVREVAVNVWRPVRKRLIPQRRVILSHNKLLGLLDGADGVKTGYTDGAGRCLVGSASRGDQRMIAVLLNAPHRWQDAAMLLEYGFQVTNASAGDLRPVGTRMALDGILDRLGEEQP